MLPAVALLLAHCDQSSTTSSAIGLLCNYNSQCESGEDDACGDCGTVADSRCNNNRICEPGEMTCTDCSVGVCNNDGLCGGNESSVDCADCQCNQNQSCEPLETVDNCAADCGFCVIDGVCDWHESASICPSDCVTTDTVIPSRIEPVSDEGFLCWALGTREDAVPEDPTEAETTEWDMFGQFLVEGSVGTGVVYRHTMEPGISATTTVDCGQWTKAAGPAACRRMLNQPANTVIELRTLFSKRVPRVREPNHEWRGFAVHDVFISVAHTASTAEYAHTYTCSYERP